jgi:predicted PurR-regulated permease PerM
VLGRRLPINQTALFIGIMFWWYLWGTAGAILAVPILVTFKVVCDHVETLRPLGTFLGNE